ncbi:hypothetical protein Clacol_005112 [Clathrus columnatus]|uniref:Uncharacterized protein n=1 Tax=Clathrus columnatus TaxID=1419009 RepID=A0AAV5ADU1_9AGAM|nr:hypothetical protein Clacol_005112 [Clathrus columnatus]
MPESSLLSVRTFIEDRRSNRNTRRRSRFLEIVGQLVVPPRYVRIEVSLADTADEWDVYPLDSEKCRGVQYDKYYFVIARKEVSDAIPKSDVVLNPWLYPLTIDAGTSKYKHTSSPITTPVPSRPRVLKKTRKKANNVSGKDSFVVINKEEINLSSDMKLTTPLNSSPSLLVPGRPTPKHHRVLVKKRPLPRPNKPRQIEKSYSSDKPYQSTLSGSLLSVITGFRKDIWADPEVTGEYISFLPSLKETKDRNEIFRRQGVVRGYPKRAIPPYRESAFGPLKKKNKWSFWLFGEAKL